MNSWAISACSSTSPSHRIVSAHACQCSPKDSSPAVVCDPAFAWVAGSRTFPAALFFVLCCAIMQIMKNAKARMYGMSPPLTAHFPPQSANCRRSEGTDLADDRLSARSSPNPCAEAVQADVRPCRGQKSGRRRHKFAPILPVTTASGLCERLRNVNLK